MHEKNKNCWNFHHISWRHSKNTIILNFIDDKYLPTVTVWKNRKWIWKIVVKWKDIIIILSKWCKNTMTSSRSWMNCTIGCTIFFIYFFAFIFFILCFLVNFLGHKFLFSILFLWIFNNCLEYEKLFWVWKIALSSLFDYFSNALSHFLYRSNYKWDIIQLNVILIVVLKKSKCFPFFLDNGIKILYILDWRNEIYGWLYSRCGC